MELRHLRAFATVAELRSFSKAAQRLHLSQPPLSRQIQQLEEEVGVQLFVRSTTGVDLTAAGRMLLEKARTILVDTSDFLETAGRAKQGAATALRVGMAHGLCGVVNRIRVHLAMQGVELSMDGTDMMSPSQFEALRLKLIDVGILRHVNDVPEVALQPLFEEHYVAAVAETSPLAKLKSITLQQVATEPLLLHERSFAVLAYDRILAMFAAAGVTPTIVTLNAEPGRQASLLAVASGKGTCLALQSKYGRSYDEGKGVVIVPLAEPSTKLEVCVAWRCGETSPDVHRFVQAARELFRWPTTHQHPRIA